MSDMWQNPRFARSVSPWSPARCFPPVYDCDRDGYQEMYYGYPEMTGYAPGMQGCQQHVWVPGRDGELEAEQDLEYLMSLCPYQVRRMQHYVEQACDDLEYDHSMLYDEIPDRTALRCLRNRVLEMAAEDTRLFGEGGYFDSPDSPAARDMAEILLHYEVASRRRKNRRI